MALFFTSDHHFGHAGARSFYRRPFASVSEMDQQMIDRWNSVVAPGDSHGKLKPLPRQFDVGVDVWDFRSVHDHR